MKAERVRELLRHHGLTAGLVALALVLAVVVLWDRGRISTSEAEDRKYQLFDAWRADDLARVDIQLGDRKLSLRVERDSDQSKSYRLFDSDRELDVDEQAVGELLVTLEFAGYERRVEGIDRKELGLEAPRAVVKLDMGKLSYVLTLGGAAPSPEGAVYAEVEGGARGTVHYVVKRELVEELETGASGLRAKSLIPYLSIDLSAIRLDGPKAHWKLERGAWGGRTAGAFLISNGRTLRASRRALDGWLVKLARVEVDKFVDVPEKRQDGAHVLTLEPRKAGEPKATLELGGNCEGGMLIVRREPRPAAGCAPKERIEALFIGADELVDLHIVGTAEGDMIELTMSAGDTVVELARKEAGWHMRKPTEGEVDEEPGRTLVTELDALEGELVAEDKAKGLDPPRAHLKIRGLPERGADPGASERVEDIDVGQAAEGYVFVRRKDDGAVLRVSEDAALALLPRPTLLRSTQINDVSAEDVRALRLDCRDRRQALEREKSGGWKLIEPDAKEIGADMGLANDLVEELRQLKAVRWVSEKASEQHDLAEPWCRIALDIDDKGDKRTVKLALGAETSGGYFARSGKEGAVFVASRALGIAARRWLLDRSALLVDLDDVSSVTIEDDKKRQVRISAQGDRWTVEGAPNSSAGAAVRQAMEQLVAEEVAHPGPVEEREGEPVLIVKIALRSGKELVLRVAGAELVSSLPARYVRRSDLDATFLVAESRLRPLFDAL